MLVQWQRLSLHSFPLNISSFIFTLSPKVRTGLLRKRVSYHPHPHHHRRRRRRRRRIVVSNRSNVAAEHVAALRIRNWSKIIRILDCQRTQKCQCQYPK